LKEPEVAKVRTSAGWPYPTVLNFLGLKLLWAKGSRSGRLAFLPSQPVWTSSIYWHFERPALST
ncbi:hypothetical protein R1flu_005463, partial [Riccia fluitans]